jgi:hypothetical protein
VLYIRHYYEHFNGHLCKIPRTGVPRPINFNSGWGASKHRVSETTSVSRKIALLMVLSLRYFTIRKVDHTAFCNVACTLELACHSKANSLILNPSRTRTDECDCKRKQTDVTWPSQFALCPTLVYILHTIFVIFLHNFNKLVIFIAP